MRVKTNSYISLIIPNSFPLVVLDEAHSIKNKSTRTARSCCEIRAKRKWCLSGTPIQNSLDDLYSLFKFLDYAPYCFLDVWKGIVRGIDYDSESGFSRLRVSSLLFRLSFGFIYKTGLALLLTIFCFSRHS